MLIYVNICYIIFVNIFVNICIYIYMLVGGLEYVLFFHSVGNNNTNGLIVFKIAKATNQYVNILIYIYMLIYVDGEYVLYHSIC